MNAQRTLKSIEESKAFIVSQNAVNFLINKEDLHNTNYEYEPMVYN